MKTMAIHTSSLPEGEFLLASLHDAVDMDRVVLDDVAMVSVDHAGEVTMHRTKGLFHHNVIDKSLLEHLAGDLQPGEAMAVIRGADAQVDAVGARARALTRGDMQTYEVVDGALTEVTGTDAAIVLEDEDGMLVEAAEPMPVQTTVLSRSRRMG